MADTLTIPASEVSKIPSGKAHCLKVGKHSLIAFKAADGSLKIAPNQCAHMSQTLQCDVEDAATLVCKMHGAKLDASSMTYKTGPTFMSSLGTKVEAGTPQPVFDVNINDDGSATLTPPAGLKGSSCTVC